MFAATIAVKKTIDSNVERNAKSTIYMYEPTAGIHKVHCNVLLHCVVFRTVAMDQSCEDCELKLQMTQVSIPQDKTRQMNSGDKDPRNTNDSYQLIQFLTYSFFPFPLESGVIYKGMQVDFNYHEHFLNCHPAMVASPTSSCTR